MATSALPSTDGARLEFDPAEQACVATYVFNHQHDWALFMDMGWGEKVAFARAKMPEVVKDCGLEIDVAALTDNEIVGAAEMVVHYFTATEG